VAPRLAHARPSGKSCMPIQSKSAMHFTFHGKPFCRQAIDPTPQTPYQKVPAALGD